MNVLEEYLNENGFITNKEAEKLGIKRQKLAELTKKGKLERIKNGIYKLKNDLDNNFIPISQNNKRVIFSHHTALFLLDLSDRVPNYFHVSVPQGYNTNHIKKQTRDIKIHYIKKDNFELGVTKIKTPFGNKVNCYDMERSICDIISKRDIIDKQIFIDAITGYFNKKNKNIRKLIKYSRILGIENEVKKYVEVL